MSDPHILGTLVLLAGLIAILVIIIFVLARGAPKPAAQQKPSPAAIYSRTAGGFDGPAQVALEEIERRPRPSADEHALAAAIITNNVLAHAGTAEGQNQNRRGVPLARTPEDEARARTVAQLFERARAHHMAALRELNPQQAVGRAAEAAQRRAARQENEQGVEAIIDQALNFAFGGALTLQALHPLAAAQLLGPGENGGQGGLLNFPNIIWLDVPLARSALTRRDDVIEERQQAAANASPAPGARAEQYIALATEHTNDGQNVHDSSVNAYLRKIIANLRRDQDRGESGPLPSLDAVWAEIAENGAAFSADPRGTPRPKVVAQALEVVDAARRGELNAAIGATDEEVLRRVWARAGAPRNAENREKLRQAVFDALIDAWKPSQGTGDPAVQCVNGRTARVLGALSLLDWDKENWDVKRLEQLKNDVFAMTRALIDAKAAEAAASPEPGLRAVGRAFLAKTPQELAQAGTASLEDEAAFKEQLRAAIEKMVDDFAQERNRATPGAIPDYMVRPIKTEAISAVI